ncbi:uncharacterized protein LACBIDRAFT_332136 [Laccaria bicolor S238N-H82]|uniref:Predicted protein n=1 Tax=Laccaria bicolor (strain S238N-H82 / ATCC MYA-4686) TaxID=486041 RepID=B0DRQ1_LACBS|nr:uncharacterized protein LACBIDRAFT_332136 [Laccaria bicolor S238N-H82]EDR02645.1 predicted protein [Laccaria bicolor S238N-H82]|eukprot:XP_001886689.1 predicted protein [Laccaria bicolor S238N-H82]
MPEHTGPKTKKPVGLGKHSPKQRKKADQQWIDDENELESGVKNSGGISEHRNLPRAEVSRWATAVSSCCLGLGASKDRRAGFGKGRRAASGTGLRILDRSHPVGDPSPRSTGQLISSGVGMAQTINNGIMKITMPHNRRKAEQHDSLNTELQQLRTPFCAFSVVFLVLSRRPIYAGLKSLGGTNDEKTEGNYVSVAPSFSLEDARGITQRIDKGTTIYLASQQPNPVPSAGPIRLLELDEPGGPYVICALAESKQSFTELCTVTEVLSSEREKASYYLLYSAVFDKGTKKDEGGDPYAIGATTKASVQWVECVRGLWGDGAGGKACTDGIIKLAPSSVEWALVTTLRIIRGVRVTVSRWEGITRILGDRNATSYLPNADCLALGAFNYKADLKKLFKDRYKSMEYRENF